LLYESVQLIYKSLTLHIIIPN